MKVIVTYASVGAGHFKAAEALYGCLQEHYPQVESKLVDALDKTNPLFRYTYIFGYRFLITRLPLLWYLAFWATASKAFYRFNRAIASVIHKINFKAYSDFLIRENPDLIVSTHFMTSDIAAYLKRSGRIKSRLITIVTDFGVHPFWVAGGTDKYIVTSDFAKEQLISEGVSAPAIEEFGIPVDKKFLQQFDRAELCKRLNIDCSRFTVLIMTGSFGLGPLEPIVDALYRDVQVLVVCAANKKLYARLKEKNLPGVSVFGFVDNIEELMAVSDAIVTKPGGLSISEVLTMELFPIFICAIPGQETVNAQVLKKYGVGLSPKNMMEIRDTVLDLRDHPDKLLKIKDNIRRVSRPCALKEICGVVCQGGGGIAG